MVVSWRATTMAASSSDAGPTRSCWLENPSAADGHVGLVARLVARTDRDAARRRHDLGSKRSLHRVERASLDLNVEIDACFSCHRGTVSSLQPCHQKTRP